MAGIKKAYWSVIPEARTLIDPNDKATRLHLCVEYDLANGYSGGQGRYIDEPGELLKFVGEMFVYHVKTVSSWRDHDVQTDMFVDAFEGFRKAWKNSENAGERSRELQQNGCFEAMLQLWTVGQALLEAHRDDGELYESKDAAPRELYDIVSEYEDRQREQAPKPHQIEASAKPHQIEAGAKPHQIEAGAKPHQTEAAARIAKAMQPKHDTSDDPVTDPAAARIMEYQGDGFHAGGRRKHTSYDMAWRLTMGAGHPDVDIFEQYTIATIWTYGLELAGYTPNSRYKREWCEPAHKTRARIRHDVERFVDDYALRAEFYSFEDKPLKRNKQAELIKKAYEGGVDIMLNSYFAGVPLEYIVPAEDYGIEFETGSTCWTGGEIVAIPKDERRAARGGKDEYFEQRAQVKWPEDEDQPHQDETA